MYEKRRCSQRCFFTEGPRGTATAVKAKNSPPDCFLNALTVLKEIISQLYICMKSVAVLSGAFFTEGPRGTATAVKAKNSPPDCFLNALTVLKEIIFQLHMFIKSIADFSGAFFVR